MRKVKNSIKKMMALCLAAIMTLAMATTAFAAGNTGNLTVKVNANNTLEGQTIKVYKLFDLTVNVDKYAYTVNDTYKKAIETALGLREEATNEALYEAISKLKDTEVQEFADDFTAAALTEKLEATKTSEGTFDENTKEYTFTDLAYGYYLVYQTGTKEIQSSLVSVDKTDATVNLKGEAPSIDKTANAETVEIGQVVIYTITGTIPDTTGYENYVYKIHDTLTAGLDFVKNEDGAAQEGTNYSVSVKIGDGQATAQNATLSGNNNRTMTLDLSDWVRQNQASKGTEFTVTYYAKVNADAVVQTNNSAHLEYGNDSDNTTETTPDKVVTPTYPLDVEKTDTQNTLLAGAVFRLYRTEEAANKAGEDAIKVTGDTGSYTVAVDQTSGNMDMTTKETNVGEGYNLHLNGLAAGDYWLVETQAPDGYNKLTAPVKVTITKTGDAEWSVSKDGEPETDKIIDIENTTGTLLPETGGMGTILFTVGGIALILIVAASFVISRRKRA